jgi:CRP/FNR family transcriptional regulator
MSQARVRHHQLAVDERAIVPVWTMSDRRDILALWSELLNVGSESATFYAPGSVIFHQGDVTSHAFLLRSGLAKLTYTLPEGTETIVALAASGQLVGCSTASHDRYYRASAIAVIETAAYQVNAGRLEQLLETNAKAAKLVVRSLELDLSEAFAAVVEMKTLTTQQRFRRLLLRLAELQNIATTQRSMYVPMPLKDREIAEVLGITRENFSRLLHKMISSRAIRRAGRHAVMLSKPLRE